MQHPVGKARNARERGRLIQIALQRQEAAPAQLVHARGRRCESQYPNVSGNQGCNTQADVTAADDQQAGLSKAAGQRAQGRCE